jgi:hypothetical protein
MKEHRKRGVSLRRGWNTGGSGAAGKCRGRPLDNLSCRLLLLKRLISPEDDAWRPYEDVPFSTDY